MSRKEFLDILEEQLSDQLQEGKVAAHIRYYEDYIQSQVNKGISEKEVLDKLGDPRLIAKTLLETDPGPVPDEVYEQGTPYYQTSPEEEKTGWKKYIDLSTWYGKLFLILIVGLILFILVTVLTAVLPFFLILGVILYIISRIRKRRS